VSWLIKPTMIRQTAVHRKRPNRTSFIRPAASFHCESTLDHTSANGAPVGRLLSGITNALLFAHAGDLFAAPSWVFLSFLIALPIIAGALTPQKPAYIVVVFLVGSVPALNDMTPVPIGLWPFLFPMFLAIYAAALLFTFIPSFVLVHLGWCLRLTLLRTRLANV
jgi:hypothetical protein